jgi:uncharacterized protein YdhG (YjbR/CyaY superfamily)
MKGKPATVDEYIAGFPDDVQKILRRIRATVRKVAPKAQETISYRVPTFKLNGSPLIYFAAFKSHIGLYPVTPDVKDHFRELSKYKGGKGTVQFPLDEPVPYDLVGRIVRFRMRKRKS